MYNTKSKQERKQEYMKIGILGAGNIAHTMAQTFIQMNSEDFELYAIGSSSLAKSEQFARNLHCNHSYHAL